MLQLGKVGWVLSESIYRNTLIKYCSRRILSEYHASNKEILNCYKNLKSFQCCRQFVIASSHLKKCNFYGKSITLTTNFNSILIKPISFSRHSAISAGANKPTAITFFSSWYQLSLPVSEQWLQVERNCAALTVCGAGCITLNFNRSQLLWL
jgi:hypothetical protein